MLSLALAGCDWHGNVVPVSGRVTLNGQPLKDASVSFQPISPGANERPETAGSAGKTDANGHFTLRLIDPDRDGALIGQHTVTISTATSGTGDGATSRGERVPKAWRDGSKHFDVPAGGTTAANFDLKGA